MRDCAGAMMLANGLHAAARSCEGEMTGAGRSDANGNGNRIVQRAQLWQNKFVDGIPAVRRPES
jgi:hypothetical protein